MKMHQQFQSNGYVKSGGRQIVGLCKGVEHWEALVSIELPSIFLHGVDQYVAAHKEIFIRVIPIRYNIGPDNISADTN